MVVPSGQSRAAASWTGRARVARGTQMSRREQVAKPIPARTGLARQRCGRDGRKGIRTRRTHVVHAVTGNSGGGGGTG